MGYEYVKNSRHNLKQRLLYVMGEKCCICGYNKCSAALEFHHKNSKEKDFTLSANANISFAKANEEIKKCILVCANCHREIHNFNIDVTQYNCYDENKAQEKFLELEEIKTKKIHYCKNCGKIISAKAEHCVECALIEKRVCDRPSREELKQLIRIKPFTQIANQFNVSDNAIRKWCLSMNLPSKKADIKNYSDEEWSLI